jgi:hypothetical protein
VLADAGELAGGQVLPTRSTDPLRVDAFAVHGNNLTRIIIASFWPGPQEVTFRGLPTTVRVRSLDESTADPAMREPEAFRHDRDKEVTTRRGNLTLELLPYAVTRIDHPAA